MIKGKSISFPLFHLGSDPHIGWRKCDVCNKRFSILNFEKHLEEMKEDPLHVMHEVMTS